MIGIVFALIMGIAGWICHLIFILMSLRSKPKGLIEIYYNKYHELYPEILMIVGLLVFMCVVLIQIMTAT